MATHFGFMPVLTGRRYFISYKSEDTQRVGEITRRLNEMGVPGRKYLRREGYT